MITWLLLVPVALFGWALIFALIGWAIRVADDARPARLDLGEVSMLFREAAVRMLFLLMRPVAPLLPRTLRPARPPSSAPKPSVRPAPVLLLPDIGLDRSEFVFLRTFLVQRGWRWVHPVNLKVRGRSLADLGEEVRRHVDALRDASRADRVDIVGHGAGGLAAAWYVRHLGGSAHVRRLVTLGTPWNGTRTAVFLRRRVATDLLHGAPMLDDLSTLDVPTISIWSPSDPIVVPTASAAGGGEYQVRIEGVGHVEMATSTATFRATQVALSHPLDGLTGAWDASTP